MKNLIKVVGAIIENENNEILCALHSPKMALPNLWEFTDIPAVEQLIAEKV